MEQEAREKQSESEDASIASTKSSISISDAETLSDLMPKLLSLLTVDKVPGMMAVRKGRVSLINI